MIKKLSFLLIFVHILCAQNFAESYNNLDSAVNSIDSAAESSAESTQNAIVDSAKSINPTHTNPPPQSQNAESKSVFERYFAKNPAFGDKQNSIRLEFGASVRSKDFENQYQAEFIYSQPNCFFRLHGRLNIEVGGFFSFGSKGGIDLSALNLAFAGVSEDILLPLFVSENGGNLYFGAGIGAYIKSKGEGRVISNFTFGERVFVGYFYDSFNIEIFIKHFSNGTLARPNKGHNFFGITAGWVF